jgi:hypothetical protein
MACSLTLLALSTVCGMQAPNAQSLTPRQQLARDIYQELIEINTVTATGDTLRAAEAMAARLRAGGFDPADRASALARARQKKSRRAPARQRCAQADPAARAHRRRRGAAHAC